jgi:pyruvate ferredoxin oxidoreductase beta subunit
VNGPAVLHIFAPCPTGWRCEANLGIRLGRLAVESGVFPLYEVVDGKYTINLDIDAIKKSVADPAAELARYLFQQGRFRHLRTKDELLAQIRERLRKDWTELKAKAEK